VKDERNEAFRFAISVHWTLGARRSGGNGGWRRPFWELEITLLNSKAFEKDRKWPAGFSHKKHARDYGVNCCGVRGDVGSKTTYDIQFCKDKV